MRGVAILMTLAIHSVEIQKFPDTFRHTWAGVELFFVISGFVVGLSLMSALGSNSDVEPFANRVKSARGVIQCFFVRRAYRILPMAILGLLVPLLLSVVLRKISIYPSPADMLVEILCVLSGFYNYTIGTGVHSGALGVYWSLAVEEQFYLLAPFLFAIVRKTSARFIFMSALLAVTILVIKPLTMHTFDPAFDGALLRFPSHRVFDSIAAGLLLAVLKSSRAIQFSSLRTGPALLVGTFCVTMIAFLPSVYDSLYYGTKTPGPADAIHIPIVMCCSLLVFLAGQNISVFGRIAGPRHILIFLGTRSYALYLMHIPFIRVQKWAWNTMTAAALKGDAAPPMGWAMEKLFLSISCWVALLLICDLLHRFFEVPLIRKGRMYQPGESASTGKNLNPQLPAPLLTATS